MTDIHENNFLERKRETLYRSVIQKAEKELIERMLEATQGNQIVAARNLGINRNTIRAKIRQLNIQLLKFKK
ncbi:MAG: helix-turn-helix domain-containing protein [Candidatus Omnitrophota bacterium]